MAFLENVSVTDNPTIFLLGGDPKALGEERAIIFDSVISESHVFSSVISKHPISTGATITDHVISNNTKFNFKCIVSDTPHQEYSNNAITKEDNPSGSGQFGEFRKFRTDAAYRTLVELDKSKKLFTIVTSHATYPNCAIQNMVLNKNPLALLDISLSIERLRIVSTEVAVGQPIVVSGDISDDVSGAAQQGQSKTFFDQSPAVEAVVNSLLQGGGYPSSAGFIRTGAPDA